MNYLKELNAFYDRLEQSALSASAVALWHALMHVNNKTRWKNEFTAAGAVLRFKAGLTESSFKRARTELKENGYIDYQSQTGGRAPIYRMISLVAQWEQEDISYLSEVQQEAGSSFSSVENQVVVQEVAHLVDWNTNRKEHQTAVQHENMGENAAYEMENKKEDSSKNQEGSTAVAGDANQREPRMAQGMDQDVTHDVNRDMDRDPDRGAAPLNKQYINKNKTIQNKTNTSAADDARGENAAGQKSSKPKSDAIVFYQENFGFVGPFVAESLMDWINDLGEALVVEAMKRALEQNKTSWGYVKSILNSWYKKGIRTLEQVEAEKVAYENARQKKRTDDSFSFSSFASKREQVVPEWFYERKQERQQRGKQEREKRTERTQEEMQAELRELKRELKERE